jgi:four helix bundle protein
MAVASYQQLKVWQLGVELAKSVYRLSQKFPKHELYGLTSQIRRAAVSIAANIAEGHARDSTKEFLHHISIALGSLAEIETMLVLAENLEYCKKSDIADLFQDSSEEGRMLRGLQKTLKSKLNQYPSP